jgi:hypothetical protein
MNHKQGIQVFARALRVLVESATKDNGKSYDELAEKIRLRAADGLIEEAIGYLPEELETRPEGECYLKPLQFDREGQPLGRHPGSHTNAWPKQK